MAPEPPHTSARPKTHQAGPWRGVDGCRGGWLVASLDEAGGLGFELVETAREWAGLPARRTLVDMPVGLFGGGRVRMRECDLGARSRLGPRRASVFAPPVRDMLEVVEHSAVGPRGLSIQAFHLRGKIKELDDLVGERDQAALAEGHPELAFARLNGAPMEESKRCAAGREARTQVLAQRVAGVEGRLNEALRRWRRRDVAEDDLLDATVLAVAARDWERGLGWCCPETEVPYDERGLRMEIRG